MDMYGKAEDSVPTKKPWTEQEVLLLLEVHWPSPVLDGTMTALHAGFGIAP